MSGDPVPQDGGVPPLEEHGEAGEGVVDHLPLLLPCLPLLRPAVSQSVLWAEF